MRNPFFECSIIVFDNCHRLLFVLLHHGRIPDNIGEHDGGELAGLRHFLLQFIKGNSVLKREIILQTPFFSKYSDVHHFENILYYRIMEGTLGMLKEISFQ